MADIHMQLLTNTYEHICSFAIPEEVVKALKSGEAKIVTKYIGWDPKNGILSTASEPNEVMCDDKQRLAGRYQIGLSEPVSSESDDGFLPHMTREERRKQGYIK